MIRRSNSSSWISGTYSSQTQVAPLVFHASLSQTSFCLLRCPLGYLSVPFYPFRHITLSRATAALHGPLKPLLHRRHRDSATQRYNSRFKPYLGKYFFNFVFLWKNDLKNLSIPCVLLTKKMWHNASPGHGRRRMKDTSCSDVTGQCVVHVKRGGTSAVLNVLGQWFFCVFFLSNLWW